MAKRSTENKMSSIRVILPNVEAYEGTIIEKQYVDSLCIAVKKDEGGFVKLEWLCTHKKTGDTLFKETNMPFRIVDLPSTIEAFRNDKKRRNGKNT